MSTAYYAGLAGSLLGVFSADISWLTQTCDALLQSCEVLLQSCDVLFYGEKTDFLAKCASQPPILKQKSTSQVAGCTSRVAKKYITGRRKYITGLKTWQIYLTGPLGLYRRTQPPYRARKDLLNWGSLRIF